MKKVKICSIIFLFVLVWQSDGIAMPCYALNAQLLKGNFVVVNQAASTKRALQQVEMIPLGSSEPLPDMGDGVPVSSSLVFDLVNLQFASGAEPSEVNALSHLNRAAFVSLSKATDSCFLLWYSSDLRMTSVNQVLSQNQNGDLQLGSDNRLLSGLQMLMVRR